MKGNWLGLWKEDKVEEKFMLEGRGGSPQYFSFARNGGQQTYVIPQKLGHEKWGTCEVGSLQLGLDPY